MTELESFDREWDLEDKVIKLKNSFVIPGLIGARTIDCSRMDRLIGTSQVMTSKDYDHLLKVASDEGFCIETPDVCSFVVNMRDLRNT